MSDYISESTIDNPPKEPKEVKQEKFFDDDEHEDQVALLLCTSMPKGFEFKLNLTLKATDSGANGNPTTLPIAAGQAPADRVEELLTKHFSSEYFLQRLRATVGMPFKKEKQTEIPTQNKEDIPGGEDCKPFTEQSQPETELIGIEYDADQVIDIEEDNDNAPI